jgi:hypothetical protein
MDTDPDDFVRQGIGTFVERFGRDVPVQLNSPVTAIHYGAAAGGGVLVETAAGKYHAHRVVVTVSTGVLAARRIAFAPELPEWKWEAIRGLPMGLLNKIIFRFDDDILPHEADSEWVLHQQSPPPETGEPEVMAFVVKPRQQTHCWILRGHAGRPLREARRQGRRRLRQGGAHPDVWS